MPRRYLHRQLALAADAPLAAAGLARLRDDPADAPAVMAGPRDREEPLLHADLAVAVAVGAPLRRAARRGPRAAARVAGLLPRDLQRGLGAVRGFLERDLQVVAQVAAAAGAAPPAAAAEPEQIAQPAEDVPEVVEDRRVDAGPAGCAADPGVPEAVVSAPLLGVREHGVGFRRLLEPFLGGLVAGVAVRMVLEGQLAVGALDVRVLRGAGNAENLVVVARRHAFATLTIDGRSKRWCKVYPRLNSSTTSPSRWPSPGLVRHRLVEGRVEVGSDRLDGRHAALRHDVEQLPVNDLDPAAVGVSIRGVRVQGPLEIVDDRQQVAEQIAGRLLDQLAPLAFGAFSIVVELGRDPQQTLVVRVALADDVVELRTARVRVVAVVPGVGRRCVRRRRRLLPRCGGLGRRLLRWLRLLGSLWSYRRFRPLCGFRLRRLLRPRGLLGFGRFNLLFVGHRQGVAGRGSGGPGSPPARRCRPRRWRASSACDGGRSLPRFRSADRRSRPRRRG